MNKLSEKANTTTPISYKDYFENHRVRYESYLSSIDTNRNIKRIFRILNAAFKGKHSHSKVRVFRDQYNTLITSYARDDKISDCLGGYNAKTIKRKGMSLYRSSLSQMAKRE